MKEKLEACFERLQTMEIRATVGNLESMLQSLYDIREVYQALKEKDGDDDAKAADLR